jgi:ATP-dependent DNA ligase
LRYVGMVSTGIPEDVREEINSRLKQLPAVQPVVPCSITGKWVQPKLTCSVAFKSWSSDGYFQQPTFDKILAEVQSQ